MQPVERGEPAQARDPERLQRAHHQRIDAGVGAQRRHGQRRERLADAVGAQHQRARRTGAAGGGQRGEAPGGGAEPGAHRGGHHGGGAAQHALQAAVQPLDRADREQGAAGRHGLDRRADGLEPQQERLARRLDGDRVGRQERQPGAQRERLRQRIPVRTPAASAAAEGSPMMGWLPGSGPSAAATAGSIPPCRRAVTANAKRGTSRAASMGAG